MKYVQFFKWKFQSQTHTLEFSVPRLDVTSLTRNYVIGVESALIFLSEFLHTQTRFRYITGNDVKNMLRAYIANNRDNNYC